MGGRLPVPVTLNSALTIGINVLNVSIKITGTEEDLRQLRKLGDKLTDYSDAMGTIGKELSSYYSGQAFASEGGVFGAPWKPLTARYARSKAKKYGFGAGLLVGHSTPHMRDSFKSDSSKTSATIYNTSPHFAYHQSSAPRHKLPRRQMMGVNEDVKKIVKQVIEADIAQKMRTI